MTENYVNDLFKANLILSDYTLANGNKESQKIFIDLLDKYVMRLNDPTITAVFIKLTSTKSEEERDVYIQILMDIFEDQLLMDIEDQDKEIA